MPTTRPPLVIRYLMNADYQPTHDAMLARTLARIEQKKHALHDEANDPANAQSKVTADELWIVDHNNVYTLGQAGKLEHILGRDDTPVIKTDRGGQVTWHGHGQLVVYFLFDLNGLGWGVRDLVTHAEQIIGATVMPYLPAGFSAKARQDAPGVYIYNSDGLELGKIASLGFKIKQGFSYHGIALNVNNDLTPFNLINPCGYAGMTMLRLADFAPELREATAISRISQAFIQHVERVRQ